MSRFNIKKAVVAVPDVGTTDMWAVMRGNALLHVTHSNQEATDWLREHRERITQNCQHLNMTAEVEVVNGALTLTCDRCGMVGEFGIDVMQDITWVGQQ